MNARARFLKVYKGNLFLSLSLSDYRGIYLSISQASAAKNLAISKIRIDEHAKPELLVPLLFREKTPLCSASAGTSRAKFPGCSIIRLLLFLSLSLAADARTEMYMIFITKDVFYFTLSSLEIPSS